VDLPPDPHGGGGKPGQNVTGFDRAQQASQVSGVQNVYFGDRGRAEEAAVSIVPPFGQRDENMPLRGREELLAELAVGQSRVQVLHGLGGCGKTSVALEVAYRAEQRGAEAWWVPATDASSLVTAMRALGRRLGVSDDGLDHGDAADVIWRLLAAKREPWLLVIDNADDPQILAGPDTRLAAGRGWLRPVTSAAGLVLVTSRDGDPASWGSWCSRHRLGALAPDRAAEVLADYAGHLPGLGTEEEARALAERLGGLPLALKIAGSYLAESAAIPFADTGLIRTYRQYLDALAGGHLAVVFPSMTQAQAREVIGRTWDMTLDFLDGRGLPDVRRMLRLLAVFADAPIPYTLLLDPATLDTSPLFPGITSGRLWQALRSLDGFGLIDLIPGDDGGKPVVRLHPLVRDTSAPRLDTPAHQRASYLDLAARLLRHAVDESAPEPEDPATWGAWQLLLPHALHVFDTLQVEPGDPDDALLTAAYVAGSAARYQAARGVQMLPEVVQRSVLAVHDRLLGAEHPDSLGIRYWVAYEMASAGDYVGAEAEYRQVLEVRLRTLGPDNPETLTARHEIARMKAAQGDHAGAEAEFREVMAARLQAFGPDHPHTLTTRHCIAYEMAERGDLAGAEAEFREVLAIRLRVHGPGYPYTLAAWYEVARMLAEQEKYAAAEAEFREVLAERRLWFGPDHPDTLVTQHWMAWALAMQGNNDEAETEMRAVLNAQRQVLGPDHPHTQTSAAWVDYLERQRGG